MNEGNLDYGKKNGCACPIGCFRKKRLVYGNNDFHFHYSV